VLKIDTLYHGGIMVNYRCTAACRHCLYACSPTRRGEYLDAEKARELCGLLVKGRVGSVHIGGGEPFLDFEGLLAVIRELRRAGISLDYIETNAFWASDDSAREKIMRLKNENIEALCISVDPFHAEYVPWGLPLLLARLCVEQGLGYFLWKQEFVPGLSGIGKSETRDRAGMEKSLGKNYIYDTAAAYGIRLGGRALNIEEEYSPRKPAPELLDPGPCRNLLSSGHFHVDPDACFIPPGCTGLRLPLAEILGGIPSGKYPVFETLFENGISGLLEFARRRGFVPDKRGYASTCNFCFHLRRFLARSGEYAELDPEHYEESLKFYS
jgi:hypothetical protein